MKATEVTAVLAESNGSLLRGLWRDSLHVTCGLTACTPVSAPGPTLGNEYAKTLPFTFYCNKAIALIRLRPQSGAARWWVSLSIRHGVKSMPLPVESVLRRLFFLAIMYKNYVIYKTGRT